MSLDIKSLLLEESKEQRENLKEEDIKQTIEDSHAQFIGYIQHERDTFELEAMVWRDKFWIVNEAMRKMDSATHGFYGTRVRRAGGNISMEWFRIVTVQGGKSIIKTLKLDKDSKRYLKKEFSKAAEWEWEIIEIVEAAYSRIRISLAELKALKKEKTAIRKSRLLRVTRSFKSV